MTKSFRTIILSILINETTNAFGMRIEHSCLFASQKLMQFTKKRLFQRKQQVYKLVDKNAPHKGI
jgi:hypothetical protein